MSQIHLGAPLNVATLVEAGMRLVAKTPSPLGPESPILNGSIWFCIPYLAMHKGSMHLSWFIPLAVEERIAQRKAEGTCISFIVNSPGGELTTFGTMLTSMATVPWSPCTHGLILQFTWGIPSIST